MSNVSLEMRRITFFDELKKEKTLKNVKFRLPVFAYIIKNIVVPPSPQVYKWRL